MKANSYPSIKLPLVHPFRYLKSKIFDHSVGICGHLAGCRQVAVDEDGIGWIEAQRLKRPQIELSPARNADFLSWINEAE